MHHILALNMNASLRYLPIISEDLVLIAQELAILEEKKIEKNSKTWPLTDDVSI